MAKVNVKSRDLLMLGKRIIELLWTDDKVTFNLSQLFFFFKCDSEIPAHCQERLSHLRCGNESQIDLGITFNPDQLLTAPILSMSRF